MTEQKPATPSDPIAPILLLFGVLAVALMLLVTPMASRRQVSNTPTPLPLSTTAAPVEPTTVAAAAYDPIMVSAGELTFQSTCAACHGFNAQGVPGLGKTLIGSEFVNSLTDEELVAFIARGRDITDPLNTTGVMMPPKGGNPALSETNLYEVVAYIRTINAQQPAAPVAVQPTAVSTTSGPTAAPTEFTPPSVSIAPTAQVTPAPVQTTTGELDLALVSGEDAYIWSCAGCHGANGEGVPNIGPSLAGSALLDLSSGIALYEFLAEGRPYADPRETYPHPARGVYPQLTDEQIRSLIAYLYTLNPGS